MSGDDGLVVDHLSVRFGGLVAVDDLSFTVPPARLTALIGPNGAGKTTTFNACSGFVSITGGALSLSGRDISGLPPHLRARLGLGRTFQQVELFESRTVRENVAMGREARVAGMRPMGTLHATRQERHEVRAACEEALEVCGLATLQEQRVAGLSTGQRRLVELARALAAGFDVLLLDEPSSGLDVAETEAFGRTLQRIVDERGTGILLVEHDMALVTSVCTYLYVLDFGTLLEEGPTGRVVVSEKVRAAYLGTEAS